MIKTVLFDLDGTLLPMDYEKFMKMYFKSLVKKASIRNYEPNKLIDSVWKGTYAQYDKSLAASGSMNFISKKACCFALVAFLYGSA